MRSSPPLACGHIVTKGTPYGGTCTVCQVTEFCARCQLRCTRCQRVLFTCCAVLYSEGAAETYYWQPCEKTVRRRQLLGAIGEALAQPFVAAPPDDAE